MTEVEAIEKARQQEERGIGSPWTAWLTSLTHLQEVEAQLAALPAMLPSDDGYLAARELAQLVAAIRQVDLNERHLLGIELRVVLPCC